MDFWMKTVKFGAQYQLRGNKNNYRSKLPASVIRILKQANDSGPGDDKPQSVIHYTDLVTRREMGKKLLLPKLASRGRSLTCSQTCPSLPSLTNSMGLTVHHGCRKHSITVVLPKLPPTRAEVPPRPPTRRKPLEQQGGLQSHGIEGQRSIACDSPFSCESLDVECSTCDPNKKHVTFLTNAGTML